MSLVKNITTNVFSLSASNFIARFLSFFSILIIIRGLSLYEYGLLTLAMAITGPIAAFSGMGLDSVFIADTSRYLGEKNISAAKRLIIGFVRNKIIITLFFLLCGWFLKSFLEGRYGEMISIYFFWLAIWVLVQSLRAITDLLAQIYEKFVLISISNIAEVVVKLIVALIFLKTVGLTVITVLLIYIVSKFASFVFSALPIMLTLRGLSNVVAVKKSILWDIIKKHGKWEIARHLTSSISVSIKPWFIKVLLSTEAVAIYSLAQTVYSVISQAIPIKNVILPVIAKKINDRFASSLLVQKANKYSVLFYLCAIVLFFVFGEYLIVLFFPKYEASVFLIKLMLFVLLTTTITAHQAVLLYGLRQQRFLLTSQTLIGVFSRLTVLPLCLFIFGLEGIVFEMLISSIIMAFLVENFLRKKFEMSTWSIKSLFIFDSYDKWFLGKVMLKIKRILKFRVV